VDDPSGVENLTDPGPEISHIADAAAIDPDPAKATAVEEAKIVIADRAQDAPMSETAADPNQNC
jgi:hypothetical protein